MPCWDNVRPTTTVVHCYADHVPWYPPSLRPGTDGDIDHRLQQTIREVCAERDCNLIELDTIPDHLHLLVECDPPYGIHRLVKQVKARSRRILREEFPSLTRRLPTMWTHSYVAATVGGAPWEIVKRYVENQPNK